jgi:hypothetical protein
MQLQLVIPKRHKIEQDSNIIQIKTPKEGVRFMDL